MSATSRSWLRNGWVGSISRATVQRPASVVTFRPYPRGGTPSARRWPKVPPNYVAFRWNGYVHQVSHVEGYVVTDALHDVIPEILAGETWSPHIVYRLGPAIPMAAPLPSGTKLSSVSVLGGARPAVTSPTLKQALVETRTRTAASTDEPA